MADYAEAQERFVDRSRVFISANQPKWIVLHKTAGFQTAEQVAEYFATTPLMTSVHYVVGRDGTVIQCVREEDGAGGNCCTEPGHAPFLPDADGSHVNLNLLTISIEHVDPASDNSTPCTPEQTAASFRLIADICRRRGIPAKPGDASGGIIGHFQICPQSRARCPGNFPWTQLWDYLAQGGVTMLNIQDVKTYFTQIDDHHWKCIQTNCILQYAILDFYRTCGTAPLFGLTLLGLPLTNEQPLTGHTNVVIQRFERGVVCWDPAHQIDNPPGSGPVYLMHLDSGPGQDPRIPQLQQALEAIQGGRVASLANQLVTTAQTLLTLVGGGTPKA